jgi:signal recognition particle subunit SRP54
MLETLTRGFRSARDRLRGATELSDDSIAEALGDVRRSLLEADVDLGIVREFLKRVQERCLGETVRTRAGSGAGRVRVSAGDHFTKACYDELVELMGTEQPIAPAPETRTLMLLGLQGTGKTSAAAKLALHLKKQGERPLLVAADLQRPAAREQLRVLGAQIGVEVFTGEGASPPEVCAEARDHAREHGHHTVIVDTAGRLQIDEELMNELQQISERVEPELQILVCDALQGREAVNVAKGFAERLELDGLILTKLDGDARGGAALAIRSATGVPVRCVSMGEAPEQLESFRPEGLASRILGMGDVVGLVKGFEAAVDADEAARAEKDAERILRGRFTLEDFLAQLRMLQKLGPLRDVLEKLPGAGELFPDGAQVDGSELRRIEAMILSMTPRERTRPDSIDASRVRRIAAGSGTPTAQVDEMLERFRTMREMLGQMGKGSGLLGRIPGLQQLAGGGAPDLGGLDPALLGGGAPGNRRAARALRSQTRRDQRKKQRKHKRRGKRR